MRSEKRFTVINYNKKRKEQVEVIFYIVNVNDFGKSYVVDKDTYVYNNLYHFLKNENKRIEFSEIEYGADVYENKTSEDVLNYYDNMFHF